MSSLRVVVVAGVLAGTAEARAGVCAEIDAARDGLSVDEQAAARLVLEQAAQAAGQTVGGDCSERWQVSHVRLGASLQVLLVTPRGAFTASAGALEELPRAYAALVRQALGQVEAPAEPVAPGPPPVAVVQAQPPGLRGVFYARVGYAMSPVADDETTHGPLVAGGYRRWIGSLAFDLSVLNIMAWEKSTDNYEAVYTAFVELGVFRLFEHGHSATYLGGSLGYGQTHLRVLDNLDASSQGIHAELSVGHEMLRDQPIRLFVQLDLAVPFYQVEYDRWDGNGQRSGESYAPTLALTTAIGF